MRRYIIIGGGADLTGRGMGEQIDAGLFGEVVRVNKPYGAPEDVGRRLDVLVTRWPEWVPVYFPGSLVVQRRVVLNVFDGFTAEEYEAARREVGWQNVSAGLLACCWALNRGARQVFAIGFGYRRGQGWPGQKMYPDGTLDPNPNYNWPAENRWLENNVTLL